MTINALFFDLDGCGPDLIKFGLKPMPALADIAPPSLGLMVEHEKGSLHRYVMPGGFLLDRAAAAEMHRAIGEWLDPQAGNLSKERDELLVEVARQRKMVEELTEFGIAKDSEARVVCGYCQVDLGPWPPTAEMANHDQTCAKNPLVVDLAKYKALAEPARFVTEWWMEKGTAHDMGMRELADALEVTRG